jgi:hypothetical protein
MSFIYVPAVSVVPISRDCGGVKAASQIPYSIWYGVGKDDGLLAFQDRSWIGKYVISKSLHPSIVYNGRVLKPIYSDVNGHFFWGDTEFGYHLYYSRAYSDWILSLSTKPGTEPLEGTSSSGEYIGDKFFTVTFPSTIKNIGRLERRGCLKQDLAGLSTQIKFKWDSCWTSSKQYGIYEPLDDNSSGTKFFGTSTWTDSDGNVFSKSTEKDEYGFYQYESSRGNIHYDIFAQAWILGEYGSKSGWYECNLEPSKSMNIEFQFKSLTRGIADPIVLTYQGLSSKTKEKVIYFGEVSRWY